MTSIPTSSEYFPIAMPPSVNGVINAYYTQSNAYDWQSKPVLKEIDGTFQLGSLTSVTIQLHVMSVASGVIDSSAVQSPCTSGVTAPPTAVPGTNSTPVFPMPALPLEFSTVIETTMLDVGKTFTLHYSYSAPDRRAYASYTAPYVDPIGRNNIVEWYVDGSTDSTFMVTTQVVPDGTTSPINEAIRNYFWPDSITCGEGVFASNNLAGSVSNLLLVNSSFVFMGSCQARGIPCQFWQMRNMSMVVQWYWSTEATPRLLRIIVAGVAQNPLFPHHPFFATGTDVPSIASDACDQLFFNDPMCSDFSNTLYVNVHEFLDFGTTMDPSAKQTPSVCASLSFLESYGTSQCPPASVTAAVVITAIICFSAGCFCQWFRMRGGHCRGDDVSREP
jgi:hypothetical protein